MFFLTHVPKKYKKNAVLSGIFVLTGFCAFARNRPEAKKKWAGKQRKKVVRYIYIYIVAFTVLVAGTECTRTMFRKCMHV